jgi:hypothetical protein
LSPKFPEWPFSFHESWEFGITSWRVDIRVRASFKLILDLDKTCFHPEILSHILGQGLFGVGFDETIKCDAFIYTNFSANNEFLVDNSKSGSTIKLALCVAWLPVADVLLFEINKIYCWVYDLIVLTSILISVK